MHSCHLNCDDAPLNRAFRIALGDLYGNIVPLKTGLLDDWRPCVLAGLDYDRPWTRDTAINVWNGVGLIAPDVARNTLISVLQRTDDGIVIGGQYWDAIIWTTGAWHYYLYSGDRTFLATAFKATRHSLDRLERDEFDAETGLFRGAACYGDGVAAYPDVYAQTDGSGSILDWPDVNPDKRSSPGYGLPMQALSTNALYHNAYRLAEAMAEELGAKRDPAWASKAASLKDAILRHFLDQKTGALRYLVDERGGCDRQEGLGWAFAVLLDIVDRDQAIRLFDLAHVTSAGMPCVWPPYARYGRPPIYGRHCGTVWPHVQGFWADAAMRFGRHDVFMHELGRLTEYANRDVQFVEIYHPDTGLPYGGEQEGGVDCRSCARQTWSATAYIRLVLFGLVGMRFSATDLTFEPYLPDHINHLELSGLHYRGREIAVSVQRDGKRVLASRID